MDQPHVTLVNVKTNPIIRIEPTGIVTADNQLHEIDILALATGFDSVTGGYKDIAITGLSGTKLADKWREGTYTYLGLTVANFPNFMFTYGPQSPTAYANGPTIVEPQGEWIIRVMKEMRERGRTRINAEEGAEKEWKETIRSLHSLSLRDKTEGWYMGMSGEYESSPWYIVAVLELTSDGRNQHSRKAQRSFELRWRNSPLPQDYPGVFGQ